VKSGDPILIATDLSARSDRPMERARLLGREFGAPIIVLHVCEREKKLASEEQEHLRTLVREEFGLPAKGVEILFEHGKVGSTIGRIAAERRCSLIVTGVARFNSPGDFILGTTVDYLVRRGSAPVLVVKRRARIAYRRLLMPTDFSIADTRALLATFDLFGEGDYLLVHAYEAAFQAFLEHDSTAGLIQEEAERSMSRLVSRLPVALQARLDTEVVEGRLNPVVSRLMDEWNADLLILGSKSPRGGYAHYAVSDDKWEIPATEPCDVLVIPETRETPAGMESAAAAEQS